MKKLIILFLIISGTLFASSLDWESDLVFSHKYHAEEAGAECSDCHGKVAESIKGADDLLPEMETCYSCHDEDMDCESCHLQGEDPIILPRIDTYSAKFNHKIHAKNEIDCAKCHSQVINKEKVNSGLHLPVMNNCMACHDTPDEISGCYSCHTENENLVPQDHVVSWKTEHGLYSESETTCQSCHTESYCIDCHQGENSFSQSHTADFIITHGMSFLVRETDCETCHQSIDYCVECHVHVNYIQPPSHMLINFKSDASDYDPTLHAEEARMNFETCPVCHQPGDDLWVEKCIDCHN